MIKDSYTTTFTVAQSPDAVFAAIINPRAWWSGTHEGMSDRLGDTFTYRYKDIHYSKQVVTEFVPAKRLAWHVTEGTLAFVDDKTEVVFSHLGLKPAVDCYDTCSDAWTSLIQGSLKQLIETGKTELLELDAPAA